ncbi:MobA/MobL family protein [Bosea sp. OK403]|uniref:MobA/MobL family protein n=1 Tax=Bosea sp. OK403 TaxID=1855286 RepID=UPI0008E274E4|nr:MobA/MobL family protein [Bosea sp. OK403]SFJ75015.1 MobA/MobL family protein [Bosea sp. OK403]
MLDLDDIAARKRIAAEQRATKSRATRESKRAQRELEADREREIDAGERAAARALHRVNALEQQAQRRMTDVSRGGSGVADIARILAKPGVRTASGLQSQKAQKQTTRPQGQSGAVSFHFSVTTFSKGGQLADVLKGRKSASAALSGGGKHQRYIDREDAVEVVQSKAMQGYIDEPSKLEQVVSAGMEVSSFGNIGATKEERDAFWDAVDDAEDAPRKTKVILDPEKYPAVWVRLRNMTRHPSALPPTLSLALTTNQAISETVTEAEGLKLIDIFQKAGFTKISAEQSVDDLPDAPIAFLVGRGGRVQTRLVIELPHEMTPVQRLVLTKDFCKSYEGHGLPYWAAIHAPNKHNDSRNYHVHINLYDRPAKKIEHPEKPGSGEMIWDFTYTKENRDKHRNKWTSRPFQQKKLLAIGQEKTWIRTERARFAKLANQHLAAAGAEKRLDPRTYVEMGVPEKARERVNPASYARERKGLETTQGLKLADQQWATNLQSVAAIAKADASYEAYRRAWLAKALAPQHGRQAAEARLANKTANEIVRLSARKAELVNERNAISHVSAKLESRSRLKTRKSRDDADEAAIAVAGEMKQAVDDVDNRIRLLLGQIQKAERLLVKAKKLDDATIRAENYAALNKAMRGMTERLTAEPAIVVPEEAKVQGRTATTNRTSPSRAVQAERGRRSSDLINQVRDTAKAIAAERAASYSKPPAAPTEPAKPLEAPMSAAVEPRALAKEPQPGTPVASNPTRPKQLTDEELRRNEAERIARLQKRLAIARQRGRGGPER